MGTQTHTLTVPERRGKEKCMQSRALPVKRKGWVGEIERIVALSGFYISFSSILKKKIWGKDEKRGEKKKKRSWFLRLIGVKLGFKRGRERIGEKTEERRKRMEERTPSYFTAAQKSPLLLFCFRFQPAGKEMSKSGHRFPPLFYNPVAYRKKRRKNCILLRMSTFTEKGFLSSSNAFSFLSLSLSSSSLGDGDNLSPIISQSLCLVSPSPTFFFFFVRKWPFLGPSSVVWVSVHSDRRMNGWMEVYFFPSLSLSSL